MFVRLPSAPVWGAELSCGILNHGLLLSVFLLFLPWLQFLIPGHALLAQSPELLLSHPQENLA